MISILCMLVLLLIFASFGKKMLSLFRIRFQSSLDTFVFSIGLGMGTASYITLAIGLTGLIYRSTFLALTIAMLILCRKEIIDFCRDLLQMFKVITKRTWRKREIVYIAILGLFILLNLIGSIAPPTSADAVKYHLANVKAYMRQRQITYLPYTMFSEVPATFEMLYLFGMVLYNDKVSVLFHYAMGIMLIIAIIAFCREFHHEVPIALSVLVFYSTPMIAWQSTSAFIDLGFAFFSFLSLLSLAKWMREGANMWLVLSAFFTGFAIGCKTFGIFILTALCIVIIYLAIIQKTKLVAVLKQLFLLIGITTAIASPWFLKSFFNTGNPVWPMLSGIFYTRNWNPQAGHVIHYMMRDIGVGYGFIDYFLFPWNLATRGESFDGGEKFGHLILTFLPFILLFAKQKKDKLMISVLIFSWTYFSIMFFISQHARYFLPIFPGLCILAGYAILEIYRKGRICKWVTVTVIAVFLVFNFGVCVVYNAQFFPVVFGLQDRDDFLAEKSWYYKDIAYVNKNLPEDSKILLMTKFGYYLDRDYIWGGINEQGLIDYQQMRSAEELLRKLNSLEISHIFLVGNIGSLAGGDKVNKLFEELRAKYLKEIYHEKTKLVISRALSKGARYDDVFIYEIKSATDAG